MAEKRATPLHCQFSWWYNKRSGQQTQTEEEYEKSMKNVCTCATVEEFWKLYSWMIRPDNMPNSSNFHFFRIGIRPLWEDEHNRRGGKWVFRCQKQLASFYWEELLLAMIGASNPAFDSVTGVVASIRYSTVMISVWNRDASDRDRNADLREAIRTLLHLPPATQMDYKPHDMALSQQQTHHRDESATPAPSPSPNPPPIPPPPPPASSADQPEEKPAAPEAAAAAPAPAPAK
ncbi:putative eukaryotic initiation factor 4e [Paratrimastix pyriformis]|uniref:Eukaryotic initiation factor 4e n=1 Tax=Paratrimastix pyriformis TaxID=342808 RepID=A0ABQ8UMZ5_9EUKA|nr:putative eukaryotic initiation factor 4e [Paratrimastix pyriformis]|eukprot:GAFH01004600.1.p1 GENE.GAFH01004600.1~~GAFH01004600.1.p1  ORF type:complete len:233 (-),score=13.03 GAFH01004600.1:13-711(-)